MRSRFPDLVALAWLAANIAACGRERRDLNDQPPASLAADSAERAGGQLSPAQFQHEYQSNAYAMTQGKRLFEWFNCVGCHAHGGGAIGPALMDAEWLYGSEPRNIYETIMAGRPNGMPAFRGHLSETQVWQLVAYVRSLSGQASKAASPSRSDSMQVKQAEQSTPRERPTGSSTPPTSQ